MTCAQTWASLDLQLGLQLVLRLWRAGLTWKRRWGEARTSCASNSAKAFLQVHNVEDHDGGNSDVRTSAFQPWSSSLDLFLSIRPPSPPVKSDEEDDEDGIGEGEVNGGECDDDSHGENEHSTDHLLPNI